MKKGLPYIITFAVASVLSVLVFWVRGLFTATEVQQIYRYLSDGFFISGIIISGYGLLVICSNGGTFDILGYAFVCFIGLFQRDVTKRKSRTFYQYRLAKSEKKRSFAYLLLVGIFFLVLAVVFVILYMTA